VRILEDRFEKILEDRFEKILEDRFERILEVFLRDLCFFGDVSCSQSPLTDLKTGESLKMSYYPF
jgi:hypothetical protein